MKAIRVMRAERGMTGVELGRRAGVPREEISRYENGKKVPTAPTLKKIADALGVEVVDIYAMQERFGGTKGEAPKARSPRLAADWLKEVVGHDYLASSVDVRTIPTKEVERIRDEIRDEYVTIRAALDDEDLSPELREDLQATKRTFVQWRHDLTRLVRDRESGKAEEPVEE